MEEESFFLLDDFELLLLLSDLEVEELDLEEEDSEEEEEGEDLFGLIFGFCVTMIFGVFLRCLRNLFLIKNIIC